MNLLDFKSEFNNFTDVFSIILFLLVSPLCINVKKSFFCIISETTFLVNFQKAFGNLLLKFILTIASLGKHSEDSRVNVLYKWECKISH